MYIGDSSSVSCKNSYSGYSSESSVVRRSKRRRRKRIKTIKNDDSNYKTRNKIRSKRNKRRTLSDTESEDMQVLLGSKRTFKGKHVVKDEQKPLQTPLGDINNNNNNNNDINNNNNNNNIIVTKKRGDYGKLGEIMWSISSKLNNKILNKIAVFIPVC